MVQKNKIYFDHAATTPIDPEVLRAMLPYMKENFGNASSLHTFGQDAVNGVDRSRDALALFFGSSAQEVIFTSGASEADNLAIIGIIKASKLEKPHIITSNIEHPAVLEVCKNLEKEGKAEISYAKVDKKGLVSVEAIKKLFKDNTVLVTVMYVNNEIGTIQPIRDIGKMIEKENEKRKNNKIYFHTDAVQGANYLTCNADYLHVDMISLSGHKIYGPKGIGALYVRRGTPIKAFQYGGHQEYGLRPGTLNVPAIVGFGKAVELLGDKKHKKDNEKIKKLRDTLWHKIEEKKLNAVLNGDEEQRVPSNLNVSFKNIEGESALLMLDMEGFAVSTGSACASGSLLASHVLLALDLSHLDAHGSLRITLGKYNTEKDIDDFVKVIPKIVSKLRKIASQ
ncbi:MAG: aminotransferase class V-fold PLP-dependent enzyme [Patescibacteria group bacterium]|jgi:cysteine desulfurase